MSNLEELTRKWDEINDKEKELKAEKDSLRSDLVDAFNHLIHDEVPWEKEPNSISFDWVSPQSGLVYKKVVAQSYSLDEEGLANDHPEIFNEVFVEKCEMVFDSDKAQNLAKTDMEAYKTLQKYVKKQKPQIRLYRGRKPTEDDL